MRGMVLRAPASIDEAPLKLEDVPAPELGPKDVLVQVEVCGICRTDLHVVTGELPPVNSSVIPGHQFVGRVVVGGAETRRFRAGDRIGIAWLRHVDGTCPNCRAGKENLCPYAEFTGYTADGGYADLATVPEDFAYPIPKGVEPIHAAPLLCAGIIGYRALKRTDIHPGQRLGIYGFGASAHVAIQVALHWDCEVYVMTRGERHQALAREMGAIGVGGASDAPPEPLQASILFAPVGDLVPPALEALDRGGTLAMAGIYLSQIPPLDYERHLFYERTLLSVTANTRRDGVELLKLAAEIPIRTHTETFPLENANEALQQLAHDGIQGAGVLIM